MFIFHDGPSPFSRVAEADQADEFLDYLVEQSELDELSRLRIRSAARSSGHMADQLLLELGLLPEQKLTELVASFLQIGLASKHSLPSEIISEVPVSVEFCIRNSIVPLRVDAQSVTIASGRPLFASSAYAVAYQLQKRLVLCAAVPSELSDHLVSLKKSSSTSDDTDDIMATAATVSEEDVERLKDIAREAPIVRLLNRTLQLALEKQASDMHVEALEDHLRIRLRMDGTLQTVERLPKSLHSGLVSRIKILAKLNIAEQRLPQDGRFSLPVLGQELELRVSTTPALYGESVVLRLLERKGIATELSSLGFSDLQSNALRQLVNQPNGLILATGPTGSGKTTTLYAMMRGLNTQDVKLFTIEDPVEYRLMGANQIPVRNDIGLTFPVILRSVLRQDPDIVMVGEVRDPETAKIAIQAALTGHLVLTTLHTNSAVATITRLLDMGIEDYLLVSCLRGVLAQRLVRKLCQACRAEYHPDNELCHRFAASGVQLGKVLYRPVGCPECSGTGYRGRSAIHELLTVSPIIREMIAKRAPEKNLEEQACAEGFRTLLQSGLAKVASGETSIEEVLRQTSGSGP